MGDTYAENLKTLNSDHAKHTRYQRRMYALVFVIPSRSVSNNNFLNQCTKYFQKLQDLCGNIVIVLACAGSLDPNVRNNPNQNARVSKALLDTKKRCSALEY